MSLQMLTPSVIQIKKKAEKKNFDDIDLVKVIAYVDKNSKGKHRMHPPLSFGGLNHFFLIGAVFFNTGG